MSKFEIGDRVRVYGLFPEADNLMVRKGIVSGFGDILTVTLKNIYIQPHSKQCRKLKSKKTKIWILREDHMHKGGHRLLDRFLSSFPPSLYAQCYDEFVKVKK